MGQRIQYDGVETYRAEPSGSPRGAVVLIHEIWGLVPHIEAVADRLAGEGYLVLAPDLLSDAGTTPEVGLELLALMDSPDEQLRMAAQPRLREAFAAQNAPGFAEGAVRSLKKIVDVLADDGAVQGRIAVLGFCFGGTYAFALAAADDRVRAAVPFYGAGPSIDSLRGIRCPILAVYGDQDEPLMSALPELEDAMSDAGVDFTAQIYTGAHHAFFNDTGSRYDEAAAEDAWATANAFLARELAGGR